MTFYIGFDFHPHQQTLCWCDEQTGETQILDMDNDPEKVREFYSSLKEPAVIGIEASSRATWFENMISETGHKLLVRNPVLGLRVTPTLLSDLEKSMLILGILLIRTLDHR